MGRETDDQLEARAEQSERHVPSLSAQGHHPLQGTTLCKAPPVAPRSLACRHLQMSLRNGSCQAPPLTPCNCVAPLPCVFLCPLSLCAAEARAAAAQGLWGAQRARAGPQGAAQAQQRAPLAGLLAGLQPRQGGRKQEGGVVEQVAVGVGGRRDGGKCVLSGVTLCRNRLWRGLGQQRGMVRPVAGGVGDRG